MTAGQRADHPVRRADVAIYTPPAAPLYAEGGGWAGGAEIQMYQLAHALAEAGLRVRHIVEPDPSERLIGFDGGVETVRVGRKEGTRIFGRRRGIIASLATADARVYVQRCAGWDTGLIAAWARLHHRYFIFSTSSDADAMLDREVARRAGAAFPDRRSHLQYRLGLRLANAMVVQTERQRDLVRSKLGIHARVIPSFAQPGPPARQGREAFLWIGRPIEIKDPLAYVALARRLPEARFWMVVPDLGACDGLAERVRQETALPNLELLPARPRGDLIDLYRRAVALVNTSELEGFPNTFLEAWSHGTPTLSLKVDPDGVIGAYGIGAVGGGSMDRLVAAARSYWESRSTGFSEAAQVYIRRVHDPSVVGEQWVRLIRSIVR
jgi:glycosyltransferase involved in cell wall biosynthesis